METYKVATKECVLEVYVRGKRQSDVGILFLHGGPGSGAKPLMELSAFQSLEDDYCCVYFDQRGSGLSLFDLEKGISKEDIVNDVLQVVLDIKVRLKLKSIYLWGGSFGGVVASLCIENIASYFDGFMLSSPAITFSPQQSLQFFNQTKAMFQKRLNIVDEQNDLVLGDVFLNQEFRKFVFSQNNPSNSLRHICAMSSWFYSTSFEHLLDFIKVPILILQGKDDLICNYEYIDEYVNNCDCRFVEYYLFNNCGHEVFVDKKNEFVLIIREFIRRNRKC